tara:strand:- start:165 stop:431 length:267 start_codon:yes stop_codon:yes gene_type:complete
MNQIKDASIIVLIVFIIASILYGIHMFRYDFITDKGTIIRYDRITNTQCISSHPLMNSQPKKFTDDLVLPNENNSGSYSYNLVKLCWE